MRIYLKDYTAPSFELERVQLRFELDSENTLVSSRLHFNQVISQSIELNGEGIVPLTLKINGTELSKDQYTLTEDSLKLHNVPTSFVLEISNVLCPQKNESLEGLYMSGPFLVTQCEAQGFRHITFFPDRPDVMSLFEVTLIADRTKYPVLLSNGERGQTEILENNRHQITWTDPHKKPCYLFALFAGDLGIITDTFTTKSGRKVNLEVYAAHGKQNRCHHAMASLKKSMIWDEQRFNLEYDLSEYMIVAIDDFNAGAMENKGLNIFNSKLVLADSQSAEDSDFYAIESVVAHEYFHNWTGNRVTLRDWFQLSLKEGLTVFRDQEFSGDLGDHSLQRISDVISLKARQFSEDAGPNAHPVRPESCLSVDNFFTATIYEKGAELIRMMQTVVGKKGFDEGLKLYIHRHDGQAVTTEDFSKAIADANNADFEILNKWYHQAGTPTVHVRDEFIPQTGEYFLHLHQTAPHAHLTAEKDPFHIPIRLGFYDNQGKSIEMHSGDLSINSDGKRLFNFKTRDASIRFKNLSERPVVSFLQEFSAPVNVDWNRPDSDYAILMAHDLDGFNRFQAAQNVYLKEFEQLIEQIKKEKQLQVSPNLHSAFEKLVSSHDIHPGLKELLMNLPPTQILAQHLHVFDAEVTLAAKEFLEQYIGKTFESQLLKTYELNKTTDPAALDPLSMGKRGLSNTCLSYLAIGNPQKFEKIVYQEFESTKSMTIQMSCLKILVSINSEYKEKSLDQFFNQWKNDALVMNKWFSVQALSRNQDTFFDVQELMGHPSFNIKNPNNVRALLGTFGSNLFCFHRSEYDAYKFFADQIIAIDHFNPHVAAGLCHAFNLIGKLTADMKERALIQIRRIVSHPEISKNTRELLATHVGENIL